MKKTLIVRVGTTLPKLKESTGGDFEDWVIRAMGGGDAQQFVVVDATKEEALPSTAEALKAAFARVVIPGSHSMVSERLPWSERLAEWLRTVALPAASAEEVAVLGICYGHQLIAHALGGSVGFLPAPERGTVPILPLEDAAVLEDRLFAPLFSSTPQQHPRAYVCHFQSVLAPPAGSVVLGKSAAGGPQIVRFAPCCWGVQFHPEFTREITEEYVRFADPNSSIASGEGIPSDNGFGVALLHAFAALHC